MEDFLIQYGVWGIAFLLLGDDLGLPFFPPGTLIFAYSVLAQTHSEVPLYPIIIISLTIPPLANYILFFAGKRGLRSHLEKYGHRIYLPPHRIAKAQKIIDKHGDGAIFISACLSTIRPLCSLVAGSLNMKSHVFIIYHFLGVMTWSLILIGGGYFLGDDIWYIIKNYWYYVTIGVILIIPLYFYWKPLFVPKK